MLSDSEIKKILHEISFHYDFYKSRTHKLRGRKIKIAVALRLRDFRDNVEKLLVNSINDAIISLFTSIDDSDSLMNAYSEVEKIRQETRKLLSDKLDKMMAEALIETFNEPFLQAFLNVFLSGFDTIIIKVMKKPVNSPVIASISNEHLEKLWMKGYSSVILIDVYLSLLSNKVDLIPGEIRKSQGVVYKSYYLQIPGGYILGKITIGYFKKRLIVLVKTDDSLTLYTLQKLFRELNKKAKHIIFRVSGDSEISLKNLRAVIIHELIHIYQKVNNLVKGELSVFDMLLAKKMNIQRFIHEFPKVAIGEGLAEMFRMKYESMVYKRDIEHIVLENLHKADKAVSKLKLQEFIPQAILANSYLRRAFVYDLSAWTLYRISIENSRLLEKIVERENSHNLSKFLKLYFKYGEEILDKGKLIHLKKLFDEFRKELRI